MSIKISTESNTDIGDFSLVVSIKDNRLDGQSLVKISRTENNKSDSINSVLSGIDNLINELKEAKKIISDM